MGIKNATTTSISDKIIDAAVQITLRNLFFGVGSGNFIANVASLNLDNGQTRLVQPVHNLFFLIFSENGIIGLFLFCALLFAVARRIQTPHKIALFCTVLIYASLDHFFWTLNQGRFLLWFSISYLIAKQTKGN